MKNVLLILVLYFPSILFAQTLDSIELKRVDSLILVSRSFTAQSDFDNALKVNAIAEKIASAKFGKESVAYGNVCSNQGRVFYVYGKYVEAEKWWLEAATILEKILGKAHPDYATSLSNLATLYTKTGDYKNAERLNLQAKTIRENVLGKEHPDYAASLNNLAVLYKRIGDYDKAEQFYLESKAIRGRTLGKENPNYAWSLNNLANFYIDAMGNYDKAETLYLEAIAIWEKSLGRQHSDYATGLNNLGLLFLDLGDFEKAEPLFLEGMAIKKSTLGKEHPSYAGSLNSLANLYMNMGNYEKAEPLYLEAKAIRAKILGKEHPEYAEIVSNLGTLYSDVADYKKSELLLMEAKTIREKVFGKEHPDYAASLNNLGLLYMRIGNYEKVETFYLEAKNIQERILGKEHFDYALTLNNIGLLYLVMGKYADAKQLIMQGKSIREKVLGTAHPNYLESLESLADLDWVEKNLKAAGLSILEASEPKKKLLVNASHYLSERELSSYIQKFENGLNRDFSFTQLQPEMSPFCYNNMLFHKGFLLNAVSQVKNKLLSDATNFEKYNQFKSYHRRLEAEYTKPITERKNVTELEEKANTLEKELARSVAGFGEATRQVTWQEVQQKLKPNEAAIEFVHYQFINPRSTDSTMYAALVLRPGMKQPKFIPLFEEKQLDTLLKAQGKTKPEYINQLYALANPKKSLYQLIWKPLEQELIGTSTVYYSPAGFLHRLNFNAIPVPTPTLAQNKNQTLADRYQLIELGSTRQLVIPAPKTAVDTTNAKNAIAAQLYGSIQYEMDSSATKVAYVDLSKNTQTAPRGIDFGLADSTLRGGKWTYLKWTEVEINTLELILTDAGLKTDVHKAYAATEESFKSIGADKPSPRIVHLATHGFFFPDPKFQHKNEPVSNGTNEPVFKISEHPMIRSGLILSGGNHAWQTGKPFRPGLEDGILTAYEISQMNLSNTELVVLSACETGLGDIQGNEGVYGLQRAFKIAGAKYLIMSLWQVPDFHTQELMTTFYSKWLEDKMSIPDAFRAAQKVMKDKFKEPFYWAGFVLVE